MSCSTSSRAIVRWLVLMAVLLCRMPAGAATGQLNLDLPAGPAGAALHALAQQSGLQLIFRTEFGEVPTPGLRGSYTVREALDKLLSGTPLVAKVDEASGIIAVTQSAAWGDHLVQLPPYLVGAGTEIWRYARPGGFEVLSSCNDDVTRRVVEQIHRLREALALVVPADLLFQSELPVRYVIHTDNSPAALPEQLKARLEQWETNQQSVGADGAPGARNIGILRNYGFWEQDGQAIYFILNEARFQTSRLSFRADYVHELLVRRAPKLPTWFTEGMLELLRTVTLDPYGAAIFTIDNRHPRRLPGGVALFGPLAWPTGKSAPKDGGDEAGAWIPLEQLLAPGQPGLDQLPASLWRAQAALLVRWALDGDKDRREALWRLVREEATQGPVSAERFRGCFDQSMEKVDATLRRYQHRAVRRGFELRPRAFADSPVYVLKQASELEMAWVKGEVDRLKIGYVQRHYPQLTERYVEQARRTLLRAYDGGARDPRLYGLMGLCEVDARDDVAAQPWLERAVEGGESRPRVFYELARIRQHTAHPADAPLSAAAAESIWALLEAAAAQNPPLVKVYELMAEIAQRADQVTPPQLVRLAEGVRLFPRHVGLLETVVRLHAKQGRVAEAQEIMRLGLAMNPEQANQRRLARLQAELLLI